MTAPPQLYKSEAQRTPISHSARFHPIIATPCWTKRTMDATNQPELSLRSCTLIKSFRRGSKTTTDVTPGVHVRVSHKISTYILVTHKLCEISQMRLTLDYHFNQLWWQNETFWMKDASIAWCFLRKTNSYLCRVTRDKNVNKCENTCARKRITTIRDKFDAYTFITVCTCSLNLNNAN